MPAAAGAHAPRIGGMLCSAGFAGLNQILTRRV
jgi:hypothetical protein